MSFNPLNAPKLAMCPQYPEESWRKTNPESFFLPEPEVLNFQGGSVLDTWSKKFFPWKVSYRSFDEQFSQLKKLVMLLGENGAQALSKELHRLIFIEINHGSVEAYTAKQLKSFVEISSIPYDVESVAPRSDIGFALGSRLKVSSPHEIKIRVESVNQEIPLLIIANNLAPSFNQSYTALKCVIAEASTVDLALFDGAASFSYLRHTLELESRATLKQLWCHNSELNVKNATVLLERIVKLSDYAKFYDCQLFIPQGQCRVTSNILVEGSHVDAKSAATVIALNGKFDYEPIQHHKMPHTSSQLNLKMILAGRARSVFQGLVVIDKSAPKTMALQVNKNLLLSKNARVDASPRLEILPNDVVCKHGSATGEIDKKQLYYLATRGFSRRQAQQMIVKSFALEALLHLEEEHVFSSLAESMVDIHLSKLN
jgi:hypothetical protein